MAKNNNKNNKAKKVKKLTPAQKEERAKRALRKEELFQARASRWEARKEALTANGDNPEMAKYSEAEGSELDSDFDYYEESESEEENPDHMDLSNQQTSNYSPTGRVGNISGVFETWTFSNPWGFHPR